MNFFKKNFIIKNYSIITLIIFCILLKSINCKNNQMKLKSIEQKKQINDNDNNNKGSEKILSRRRRYLTFPEGSSLQLIYDQTIPIIGIELVFTVGITVALAWQLPSEPLYKITQQLKDKLNMGELERRKDKNATAINYVDKNTDGTFKYDDKNKNNNYYYSQKDNSIGDDNSGTSSQSSSSSLSSLFYNQQNNNNNNNNNYPASVTDNYYNNNIYYTKQKQKQELYDNNYYYSDKNKYPNFIIQNYTNPSITTNKLDYYFNNNKNNNNNNNNKPDNGFYTTKLTNQLNKYPSNIYSSNKWTKNDLTNVISRIAQFANNGKTSTNNNAAVQKNPYPVFGKRSIDDEILDEEMKIYLNHHRATRHALYRKIEKLLITHEKDGRSCVLKALCETGQRQHEKGTGTFVAEIMRVIFSLPKSEEKVEGEVHRLYDEAHGSNQNCKDLYPECEESLWMADFIN